VFWIKVKKEKPIWEDETPRVLMPVSAVYLREAGFLPFAITPSMTNHVV
jgi:hypothetical protein